MDSLYDRMTEDSVSELAKAGCLVDVTITGYGDDAKFRIKISKGSAKYGSSGVDVVAEGTGAEGAAALRAAVATVETFLAMLPKRERPRLPEFEPPAPAADVMTDGDPLRLANRALHRDAAEAGDRVRAAEDTAALSLT